MKINSKFRETDMRRKLNECQKVRIQSYQHRGNYIEGDKVWFKPLNGNAWLGLAVVVCQRGQSVYLHTHGDLKKIAACRVKLFKLLDRDEESASKEVMLEDGLEDVENLYTDLKDDVIGASYLKMAQSVSFSELCSYTIELPVSEHWRPEVKAAKRVEIKNLQDYETFEEVIDEGQETLGSRWVITEKEKHDDQKQKCKARLVARGRVKY